MISTSPPKIAGREQIATLPASIRLQPDTLYRWSVAADVVCTATHGNATAAEELQTTTEPVAFRTRLAAFDSAAQWIGGYNELSASVHLASPVSRATAYVSAVGAFYLYLNGQQVGDHIMDPGQGVYPVRHKYLAFELSPDALNANGGQHTFTALIGNYKWGCVSIV